MGGNERQDGLECDQVVKGKQTEELWGSVGALLRVKKGNRVKIHELAGHLFGI
ncbi:MAG: hypothetical protein JRJ66_02805 [Deltaproteobacteria bacterium]|nr:hypothetical protein [Deltaproteobacteria bacterium]